MNFKELETILVIDTTVNPYAHPKLVYTRLWTSSSLETERMVKLEL